MTKAIVTKAVAARKEKIIFPDSGYVVARPPRQAVESPRPWRLGELNWARAPATWSGLDVSLGWSRGRSR